MIEAYVAGAAMGFLFGIPFGMVMFKLISEEDEEYEQREK